MILEFLTVACSNNAVVYEISYDQNGSPLTMTKDGQTYYYILNGHKDVVGLTDASGNNVVSYKYDAWGNILSQSGSMSEENPYRYAGYRYDEESKLYYLMARYYNADERVFLTKDAFAGSIKQPLSLNKYVYNQGDPVNYIDPEGEAKRKKYKNANDWFLKTARTNEKAAKKHRYNLKWFYNQVKNKGPWDYKQKLKGNYYTLFGEVVSKQDIGNIHYGYVGTALGVSAVTLLKAAGVAQIKAGTSEWKYWWSNFDDPRDQDMIRWGIKLYYKYRKYSAPLYYI